MSRLRFRVSKRLRMMAEVALCFRHCMKQARGEFREGRKKEGRGESEGGRRGEAHLNVVGDLQNQHSVARPELDVVPSLWE